MKLILMGLLFIATAAAAGDKIGNGGGTVVCRDKRGKITSPPKLVDLYEGEYDPRMGYAYIRNSKPLSHADVRAKLEKVSLDAAIDLEYFYQKVKAKKLPIAESAPAGPAKTNDYNLRVSIKDPNCKVEPAATYFTDGIQWDDEIVKAMHPLDRIALEDHEALYWAARENRDATDSDDVRPLLAHLYSDRDDENELRGLINKALADLGSKNIVRANNNDGFKAKVGVYKGSQTLEGKFRIYMNGKSDDGSSFELSTTYSRLEDYNLCMRRWDDCDSREAAVVSLPKSGKFELAFIYRNEDKQRAVSALLQISQKGADPVLVVTREKLKWVPTVDENEIIPIVTRSATW